MEIGDRVKSYCIYTSSWVLGTLAKNDKEEWVINYDDGSSFFVLSFEHLFAA